ncbi:capsular polysaccharide synthesis protein [Actinomyces urogenitalis]|uniref:capsular polysaccharide synthesis protein n=1 Tax=Actinomyces urogenitalis TaxID=103621 RepID=UPI002432EF27|nr:capsular polysaccharide synthesis protein [Actinomyces urogenitalis]MCI7455848.1 capsular polysaccharide synthesis protein [Actinomyces urogenitalis]
MTGGTIIAGMRRIKHAGYVAATELRPVVRRGQDKVSSLLDARVPYVYSPERYPHHFLTNYTSTSVPGGLPRRVFCAWTGDNPIPPACASALDETRRTFDASGIELVLITPENLSDWVVEEDPIPDEYEYLSLIHKSDYLHAYMMHHHGGGWVGIKQVTGSWEPGFQRMEADPDKWMAGYAEVSGYAMAVFDGRLAKDLRRHYSSLLGLGATIFRANSPLTDEWLMELKSRVRYYAAGLHRHPGGVRGVHEKYPIPYLELYSGIVHPLQLKYISRLLCEETLKPDFDAPFRDPQEAIDAVHERDA